MRVPPAQTLLLTACTLLATAVTPTPVAGQNSTDGVVTIDTYWQRESGAKEYDDIHPFRQPLGIVGKLRGQVRDLLVDLREMRRLAGNANHLQLSIDADGREICTIKAWGQAHENAKANGLDMEGWLGKVLRDDSSVLTRRVCIYGIFYFNDPHKVIHLITNLPGEPLRDLREDGFRRALNYMRVHYKASKPQNPRYPDNGIVVPKYDFNPLPFFLLLDQEQGIDRAQGLWFLTEVLKIRPDLGRVYLEEVRERIPKLLVSKDQDVRQSAVRFLAAIDRKQKRCLPASAEDAELQEWLEALVYELFPPIRHISLGRVDLYPSEERDKLLAVGKRVLVPSLFPRGSAKLASGSLRYGLRLGRMPEPLNKLGLPANAILVSINNRPVDSADRARLILAEFFAEMKKAQKLAAKQDKSKQPNAKASRAIGANPAHARVPTIQIEYVYKKKALMKEYRIIQ